MRGIILAIILALLLKGCGVPAPNFATPALCKAAAVAESNAYADKLCPPDAVKWDACEHSGTIMTDLGEKLEACDGIR